MKTKAFYKRYDIHFIAVYISYVSKSFEYKYSIYLL